MNHGQRYRITFWKRDRLRFVSHHDMMLIFERALRRATLKVAHTQGFNPRPKLTFAMALPLGVESLDEIVDIELDESPASQVVAERLGAQLPPGLDLQSCESVDQRAKLLVERCDYRVEMLPEWRDACATGVERLLNSDSAVITRERKGRTRQIPLANYVRDLAWDGQSSLSFALIFDEAGSMKPMEVLEWMGLDPMELKIIKTATRLATA